jgi:hypothetical protein
MLNDEIWAGYCAHHLDRACAIIYIPPFAQRRRMER